MEHQKVKKVGMRGVCIQLNRFKWMLYFNNINKLLEHFSLNHLCFCAFGPSASFICIYILFIFISNKHYDYNNINIQQLKKIINEKHVII